MFTDPSLLFLFPIIVRLHDAVPTTNSALYCVQTGPSPVFYQREGYQQDALPHRGRQKLLLKLEILETLCLHSFS